jgi:hypothetical protein
LKPNTKAKVKANNGAYLLLYEARLRKDAPLLPNTGQLHEGFLLTELVHSRAQRSNPELPPAELVTKFTFWVGSKHGCASMAGGYGVFQLHLSRTATPVDDCYAIIEARSSSV